MELESMTALELAGKDQTAGSQRPGWCEGSL